MSHPENLILAAVTPEIGPLKRPLRLRSAGRSGEGGITHMGRHEGRPVVVGITGMGSRRADRVARELLARHEPDRVFIIGFAGGTHPDRRAGEVIVPGEVIDGRTGERLRPTIEYETAGRLVTSERLIVDAEMKAACFERFGADVVDMETAAIADACRRRGVPWLCIRAISDPADVELPPFLMNLTRADGRPDFPAALRHALTHPWDIPLLIRIGRDTRIAAEALARRLLTVIRGIEGTGAA